MFGTCKREREWRNPWRYAPICVGCEFDSSCEAKPIYAPSAYRYKVIIKNALTRLRFGVQYSADSAVIFPSLSRNFKRKQGWSSLFKSGQAH